MTGVPGLDKTVGHSVGKRVLQELRKTALVLHMIVEELLEPHIPEIAVDLHRKLVAHTVVEQAVRRTVVEHPDHTTAVEVRRTVGFVVGVLRNFVAEVVRMLVVVGVVRTVVEVVRRTVGQAVVVHILRMLQILRMLHIRTVLRQSWPRDRQTRLRVRSCFCVKKRTSVKGLSVIMDQDVMKEM